MTEAPASVTAANTAQQTFVLNLIKRLHSAGDYNVVGDKSVGSTEGVCMGYMSQRIRDQGARALPSRAGNRAAVEVVTVEQLSEEQPELALAPEGRAG